MPSPETPSLLFAGLCAIASGIALVFPACHKGDPAWRAAPVFPVQTGIDVLQAEDFHSLRNTGRIGLITNQTSVNRQGEATRQILCQAPDLSLTVLFTPEHGLDGQEKAAAHVASRTDPITGLQVHPLYGPAQKPTLTMLEQVDTLVFDLQDIGSRSDPYLSTMILAMEACGEAGKRFIVLDRPNPLGGLRVQGPPLEPEWKLFLGQIPVPYVHGMTSGELARMANAKGWITKPCALEVVPLRGWDRSMAWEDTGLTWIPTSPNIPTARSALAYVATGILGGLTGGDIGIDTPHPFEVCAAPGIDPVEFTTALHRLDTPGVSFTPYRSRTRPGVAGTRLHIHPHAEADLVALDIALVHELNKRLPASLFATTAASAKETFCRVYGSKKLEEEFQAGQLPSDIAQKWQPFLEAFRRERAPYLLY
jgi:uncharacterized protein YbbC (DUF1343 family)